MEIYTIYYDVWLQRYNILCSACVLRITDYGLRTNDTLSKYIVTAEIVLRGTWLNLHYED